MVESPPVVGPDQPARFGLRSLGGGSAPYAIGGVIGRIAPVLAVPVYLRRLPAEEYALQALALLTEQILVVFAGYAITNALGRFYADVPRGSAAEGSVIRTALWCVALSAVALAALLQPFAPVLATLTLEASARGTTIVRLVAVSCASNAIVNLLLIVLLLRRQAWSYVTVGGGVQTVATLLSIVGLVWLNGGIVGLIAGYTAGIFLGGAAAFAWLLTRYPGTFSADLARRMFRYGLPLAPAALLMIVLGAADRYALRAFRGLSEVGVYAAAALVANAANLVFVTPFRLMWGSLMWNIRGTPAERDIHRRILESYLMLQVVIVVGLAATAPTALRLLSRNQYDFVALAPVVPLIYVGFVSLGAADILSAGYFFASKTTYHLRTVAIATVSAIVLNLVLVPYIGYWGSATANATGFVLFALMAHRYGKRFFPVPYRWGMLASHLVPVAVAAFAVFIVQRVYGGAGGLVVSVAAFLVLSAWVTRRAVAALRPAAVHGEE